MPTQHEDITDPSIHEPKGTSTALVGQSYVADGAGSGAWDYRTEVITLYCADITSSTVHYVVAPFAGTVTKIYCVIQAATAAADTIITPKINAVAITNGAFTITQSGSAAGDPDSSTPTALNVFAVGDTLEVVSDNAATDGVAATITWYVRRNA